MERIPNKNTKSLAEYGRSIAIAGIATLGAFSTPQDAQAAEVLDSSIEHKLSSKEVRNLVRTALLIHGSIPNMGSIDMDPSLQNVEDVSPSLILPLVHNVTSDTYWDTVKDLYNPNVLTQTRSDRLSVKEKKNSASAQLQFLHTISEKYAQKDPIEMGWAVAMVARNFSWKQDVSMSSVPSSPYGSIRHDFNLNPKPTVDTTPPIASEVNVILTARERISSESIFAHKTIVLVSNAERDPKTHEKQFGTPAFKKFLQSSGRRDYVDILSPQPVASQQFSTFTHLTPLKDTKKASTLIKKEAIQAIIQTPLDTVFDFDGHGSPGAFYINNGRPLKEGAYEHGVTINVHEMADALEQRWIIQKTTDPERTDLGVTLIFSSCFSQDFIRGVVGVLQKKHVPLPSHIITGSEVGQYGFYQNNPYGSQFNELLAHSPSFGYFWEHKNTIPTQTPGVFVPRPEDPNKLMQLGGIAIPQTNTATG
jgi:hypothetical protein